MKYSHENLIQFLRLIGEIPGQSYQHSGDFEYIKTKDSYWPNLIFNFNPTKDRFETVLDHIESQVHSATIPSLIVQFEKDLDPDLHDLMIRRQFTESYWTAMSFDLGVPIVQSKASDLNIFKLGNSLELNRWLKIVETELMGGNALNTTIFDELMSLQECHLFIGKIGDLDIATALVFINQGNAGVYLVATRKEYRNKGYGREITQFCLQYAKELHCAQVDLQATALGKGVYQSLGFIDQGLIKVFKVGATN